MANRKQGIVKLLKGIENGDPHSVEVINPEKYIQHNPQTQTGRDGLAALFARLSKTNPRVNIVRIFADGDFVFGHTEYDFSTRRIGFEVFRFEGDQTVEHWDNIQPRKGPNPAGHSMVDGETDVKDHDKTSSNRELVRSFVQTVLVERQHNQMVGFFQGEHLIQHDPELEDGVGAFRKSLENPSLVYQHNHRLLAEGNFVLSVCEGQRNNEHTALYDLFRVHEGKIAERWNTVEKVAPPEEWKNDNGKF